MRVTNYKRIAKEDFEPEMQDTIERLATSINSFADQVIQAFNGNIGFDNLTQEVVQFDLEIGTDGKLKTQVEVKSKLRRVQGYTVIRVEIQGAGSMPTAVPLISFVQNESSVRIQSVMGVLPNVKYRITAIAIG